MDLTILKTLYFQVTQHLLLNGTTDDTANNCLSAEHSGLHLYRLLGTLLRLQANATKQ